MQRFQEPMCGRQAQCCSRMGLPGDGHKSSVFHSCLAKPVAILTVTKVLPYTQGYYLLCFPQ